MKPIQLPRKLALHALPIPTSQNIAQLGAQAIV